MVLKWTSINNSNLYTNPGLIIYTTIHTPIQKLNFIHIKILIGFLKILPIDVLTKILLN